jgi:glycosyltransferase involved in cell wall biosynthesis
MRILRVISTKGGALPEVVGDAGILVPPADVAALETAIMFLLDNPAKRRELSQAGIERVKRSFTWHHAAQKTVDVYREEVHADR